jgi:hypothetical protein
MKIVVPISKYEFDRPLSVLGFVRSLRRFGVYGENHSLLVVSRPSDKAFSKSIFDLIKDLFPGGTEYHLFDCDGPSGWPQGPNFYWKKTIEHFAVENNTQPWLWMEADLIPLKPNWIDLLEAEYVKAGKPFMGTVNNTTMVTKDKVLINIAQHLQGTAVHPPRVDEFCSIWKFVDNIPKAFDVITQWEVMPHVADTKLIQQGFRTSLYKMTLNPLMIKGLDNGDMNGVVAYDQPISDEAVLHHGCKDSSLADIVNSDEYLSALGRKRDLLIVKRKIPAFFHVPRSGGSYVGSAFLGYAHQSFQNGGFLGDSPDHFSVFSINFTLNGLDVLRAQCGAKNSFLASCRALEESAFGSRMNYSVSLENLSEGLLSDLRIFSLVVESEGFKIAGSILSKFEELYCLDRSIVIRNPFDRIQSLYLYNSSDSSKHDVNHGIYSDFNTFLDYVCSDQLESNWLVTALLGLGPDTSLTEEHLALAKQKIKGFKLYNILKLADSIGAHVKECYPSGSANVSYLDKHNRARNNSWGSAIPFEEFDEVGKKIFLNKNRFDCLIYESFSDKTIV